MPASSPYDRAAGTVSTPVISQATSSQPGLPTCRAVSADTRKMPEPIIEPTTTALASSSPRARLNARASFSTDSDGIPLLPHRRTLRTLGDCVLGFSPLLCTAQEGIAQRFA